MGTDFPGLKKVFRISDDASVVSTPRSMDTPRDSFSSEGTPRDLLSDSNSSSGTVPVIRANRCDRIVTRYKIRLS